MIYKIKVFSSFCSTNHAKSLIENMDVETIFSEKENNNVFKRKDEYTNQKVIFVDESSQDYTHVLIWNTAMPVIPSHIPKKHIVGLALEPPAFLGLKQNFVEYAEKNISKYLIGEVRNLPKPFISGCAYLIYSPPQCNVSFKNKKFIMSMIVSEKSWVHGHKYRHTLMDRLLFHKFPIDFYGRGMKSCKYKNYDGKNIKGEFKEYEPYNDYMFHICIENFATENYYSEKVINPLLTKCVPIYKGCKNINKYFPDGILPLTGELNKDLTIIHNIIVNPMAYYQPMDLKKVEKQVSLIKNVESIFSYN